MRLYLLKDLSVLDRVTQFDDLVYLKYCLKGKIRTKVYVDDIDNPHCFASQYFYPNQRECLMNLVGYNEQFIDAFCAKFLSKYGEVGLCCTDLRIIQYLTNKCEVDIYTRCRTVVHNGQTIATPTVPTGYRMGKIEREYIGCVLEHHQYGGTKEEIAYCIKNYPSVALYRQDTMVCWVATHAELSIGPLFTLPEYRGKGLAPIILAELSNQLLARGIAPYSHIVIGNTSSEALLKKVCGEFLPTEVGWCACKVKA